MCRSLLGSGSSDFGNILGAIGPVTPSMELALIALVLWLSAILDAVAFGSTVETLVVSWWRVPFALSFLLFFP